MTMLRWRASSYAQDRARPSPALCNTGGSHTGSLCLHRGLLQSNPSSLRYRLYQPDRDGAKSSLTLSIFSGEDQSPREDCPGEAQSATNLVRVFPREYRVSGKTTAIWYKWQKSERPAPDISSCLQT